MAITITQVIAAQSLASASPPQGLSPIKLALQVATSAFFVECQLTTVQYPDMSKIIRVWVASGGYNAASAAIGRAAMLRQAVPVDVVPGQTAGLSITISELQLNAGGYVYLWIENAALPAGTVLTVLVNEL